ncbi:MAG: hypothetical protein A2Y38_16530 [Spirochaetes bacterium GWB1_59_5]|nr:MAG: hypothetical protein A2Y38_16530 [Spirochaetes bacterium GWB1_59_5]
MDEFDQFLDAKPKDEFDSFLDAKPYAPPAKAGVLDRANDVGVSALKGAIGVPEAAVGLADIPTFGLAGKAAEAVGFRPKEAKAMLDEWYSPAQQEANRKVGQAEGFWGKAGAALENPSTIAHTAIESLPAMGVGGVAARGLMAAKTVASPLVAGGIGEGVVGAGLAAEQIRQGSDDGYLSPGQVGAAVASGVGTGALGVMGGKLARKMGIEDVDTAITRGTVREAEGVAKRGLAARVGGGMLSEGVLEELPQSMQEQIWQNVATGKTWNEGVAEAGAMGMLTGGVMGGGFNVFTGGKEVKAEATPEQKKDLLALPYKGIQMPGSMPEIDAMQANSADAVEAVRSNEQLWKEREDYTRSHPGLEGFPRLPGLGQSSYAIPAEATEHQTPLARFDVLQQRSLDTASRELANEQASDLAQDTRYNMPSFDFNDQTLPMPTDPGSAVAVIQVLSHAQQSGQALVEGSRAHEALVEAQRILKENGLSVLASRAPQVSAKGGRNAPTQVAQAGNQGAGRVGTGSTGNIQDQQRVEPGLSDPAGAPVVSRRTDRPVGDAGRGNGAGVNPATQGFGKKQLALWNDAVSKLGEAHPALETINEAITQNKLPVAQKALNEALAPTKIASLDEVKLPKVQQTVFDHLLAAARDDRMDTVFDSEGVAKATEIGAALGLKKGSITAAINGATKHLAKQLGFNDVAELKTYLKNRTAEVRTTQESDVANLGLSPAAQNNQVVNESDLFGSGESGAEQNMGIINSVGGSQGETEGLRDGHRDRDLGEENLRILREADRTKNDAKDDGVQTADEVEREERVKAEAKARADAENKAALSIPEAKNAAVDWDEFKSNLAPRFADLTEQAQASWVVQYVETVSNDSSNEALESAQRDFERQLESSDVRANTEGPQGGVAAELGSVIEGDQGALAAPVQKAQPVVTSKKRRIAKPEEGVGGKTQFSESEGRKATVNSKVLSWAQQVLVRRAKDAVVAIVTTPNALLKQVGIYRSITLDIEHAGHIMQTHPEIRPEDLAALSDLLQRPRAVILHGTGFNFIVDARDGAGKPLLVALNNTTLKGGGQALKVTGVSTMFGMDDSAASLVRNLQAGNVKFLAQKEVARLQGLMSLGETPRNTETSGATNQDQDLRYEGSIPSLTGETSSYTPLQAEREISVATENGEVKLSIPDGAQAKLAGVNFSEGKNDGVDAKTLGDTLRKYFFSPEKFNKLVSIYPTAEAIPADVRAAAAADAHMSEKDVPWEHVQGFAMNGKVYLVAGNIKEGNELAVFLHELGVHVGMERLIDTANMKRLSAQIETWAARNDKSQETQFAKDAVRRAADSASEDQQQEVIAYFIEEAVKHGVNPVAIQKTNSPLAQWFRSLWAAAKIALRKIGFGRFDSLTAQNMVDLAYGAANIELRAESIEIGDVAETAPSKAQFSQTAQGNPEYRNAATLAKQVKEFVFDKSKSAQYATMFGHQLAELAEKVIPGAKAYFNSVAEKQRERVQQEQAIAKIAEAFGDLPKAAQNAANKYIAESTYQSKWGFLPDWYEKDVQTTVDAAMATQFNALPKEAQAIVRDVFKFGSEQQKRFDESVNANLDPKDRVKRNQRYGSPYAPLKRFGDHVVVGKSAEFIKAEDALKQGSITQTQLDDMKSNEKHYYVEFVDGDFEAIQRRDELAATNPNLTWDKKPLQDEHRDLNAMSFTMLERLKNQIANDPDTKAKGVTKAALTSLANQLYIAQLNHLHANKSQAQRLNVKGYDNDMMRAFVSQGRAEAALIASLKTHAATEKSLQAIKQAARQDDNQDTKTRIANEIMRRHVALLNHKETPIQDKLMAVNSAYFLLTSPAYFLTNATQPFVMSLPYMTASHGGKAWGVLAGAYKQAFSLVKFFKNTQLDATHLKGFNEVGQEAAALQSLLDENLVNIGMEIELGEVADYGGNKATKALKGGMKFLRMIASNVETLNRVSTAVTAYRLAYTEALNDGAAAELAHTKATAYARDVIIKTHGDYAGYNAPSLLMQGAYGTMPVKVLGQFKKFQFIQAGLLIGTAKQALSAADPGERAVARKILAHTLGMQVALAGSLGLPLSGALASALAAMGGDDGEDKEAYLRRLIGNPTLAQFILHGAPAAAGLDVSKRIGMANAFNPLPFADSGTTNKDTAKNLFISAMGPSAALSLRAAQGMDYMGKGQYWKGLENFIPNGLATNLSKVARYESEGVTNSRGDIVMKPEEVGVMTDALQVLGLPTTVLTDRSWKAGVAYDQKQHFQSEAAKIKREYTEAIQNHENPAEARKAWMDLQAQRVKQGFKRQQMSELIGAPREQAKRERQVVNGLPYEKTDKRYIERLSTL